MFPIKDDIRADRFPFATLLLIAVNVAVYIWRVDDALLPLAANLLFLWVFGNSLEDALGRVWFIALYLIGGLLSVGVAMAAGAEALPIVGATGAAAAVLGGHLVRFPDARVLTTVLFPFGITIVAVPAIAFLGVWAALQIAFALLDLNGAVGADELIAYLAPIAGLLFGAATLKLLATSGSLHSASLPGP